MSLNINENIAFSKVKFLNGNCRVEERLAIVFSCKSLLLRDFAVSSHLCCTNNTLTNHGRNPYSPRRHLYVLSVQVYYTR